MSSFRNLGLRAFWRVVLREVYICLKGRLAFEGRWRLQSWTLFLWDDQHSLLGALEFVGHRLQSVSTSKLTKHRWRQQFVDMCKIRILLQHLRHRLHRLASLFVHIQQIMNILQGTPWPPRDPHDPWRIHHLCIRAVQFCMYGRHDLQKKKFSVEIGWIDWTQWPWNIRNQSCTRGVHYIICLRITCVHDLS